MYNQSTLRTRTPVERMLFDFIVDQSGFLADKLFDPKMVDNATKKVPQSDSSKLRVPNTLSKTNARAMKIDEQFFYRDIDLEEHKLAADINPHEVSNSDNPMLLDEARKSKIVTLGLLMQREQLAATLATTSGNYNASLTSALSAGDRWDDTGDPEAQKITADNALVLKCGRPANALAISGTVLRKLRTNSNFRDRVKYTTGGPVTDDAIKAFFNIDYLFVSDNVKNTAAEGATDSISTFWGTNAIFFVYQPSYSLEHVGFGAMYMRTSPLWQAVVIDEKRRGSNGPMREVQVGTEYQLAKGIVDGESTGLFAGGYLFRTVTS